MNFSNPKPIKNNTKQQSGFESVVEKIGAIISLVELGGGVAMPDKVNKMLTTQQKNKAVRIIIFSLIWFLGCGIFQTGNLIVQLIRYIF